MKIYSQSPNHVIRVAITRAGYKGAKYITLCECTQIEVREMIMRLIREQNLDPFAKGFRTRIDIREAIGGENGKSISLSFVGLDVTETFDLIINEINSINTYLKNRTNEENHTYRS